MASRPIDPRVQIGAVRLQVADLDRAVEFYRNMLGLEITHRVGNSAIVLTADGRQPLVYLYLTGRSEGGVPAGTSRFSLRYPDPESLDDAIRQLADAGVSPEGRLEDEISEGMFIRDPDGNRIELYAVRQRDAWQPVSAGTASERPPLSEVTRTQLGEMRARLLNLHKVLLDDAKAAYELDRGRVTSNANWLQLVINDPWFAWLHPLSELVVRIDEALHAEAPATGPDGAVLLDEVERLLSPGGGAEGFAQRYYEALQRQPAVIVAHAEVRRILKQAR